MVLKYVTTKDLPKLNNLVDEMKQVKDKIEEIKQGNHIELTEETIEENLIGITKSMDLDISDLEEELFESAKSNEKTGITTLLNLPTDLRKTARAVLKLDKAKISDISKITKRSEDAEESFAKSLVHMGYLAERKDNENTYFMPSLGRRKKGLPPEVFNTLENNTTNLERAILDLPTSKERNMVKNLMDGYLTRIRKLIH